MLSLKVSESVVLDVIMSDVRADVACVAVITALLDCCQETSVTAYLVAFTTCCFV